MENNDVKEKEERILVNIKAKGGAETICVSKLSDFIRKYTDILTLEDMMKLSAGQRVVRVFPDHVWLAELSFSNLW